MPHATLRPANYFRSLLSRPMSAKIAMRIYYRWQCPNQFLHRRHSSFPQFRRVKSSRTPPRSKCSIAPVDSSTRRAAQIQRTKHVEDKLKTGHEIYTIALARNSRRWIIVTVVNSVRLLLPSTASDCNCRQNLRGRNRRQLCAVITAVNCKRLQLSSKFGRL